eukprot:2817647-Amphidinium_carterae.1
MAGLGGIGVPLEACVPILYGSAHAGDRLTYATSAKCCSVMTICIGKPPHRPVPPNGKLSPCLGKQRNKRNNYFGR